MPLSESVVVPVLSKIVPVSPVSVALAPGPLICPVIEYGYGTSVRVKLRTTSFALATLALLSIAVPSPTTRKPPIALVMKIEESLVTYAMLQKIWPQHWSKLVRLAGKNPVCDCVGGWTKQKPLA